MSNGDAMSNGGPLSSGSGGSGGGGNPTILRGRGAQEYWFEEGCFITEWLNTPDDPALSIARARVTPGVTTRLHRLAGTVERYVILEGQGRVELVGPDGTLTSAGITTTSPGSTSDT